MQINDILNISDLHELRSLGSYHEVKRSIEEKLDNKLGVTGWESLFKKIKIIKKSVSTDRYNLSSLCEQGSFKESKNKISKILEIKVTAKSWDDLKRKVRVLINLFGSNAFDPYEHYEKTKLIKFKNSSKLEGIDIEIPNESISLESVLAKYKR